MAKLKVSIDGMHCASCATNIERSVKKVPGVKDVTVSVVTKKAFIEAEEKVSHEAIKAAVAKAGYKVKEIVQ